ncbi:MAG: Gfo/Idh/MocA family protein [Myxococcota bacterium]
MKFGIVGAGSIGTLRARAIEKCPGSELVAVTDVSVPAREKLAASYGALACADLDSLLAAPIDGVVISTPAFLHADQVVAALERGKHVLVEKPMTVDIPSGRRVLEAARASGRLLAVGFNHRYYPAFHYLKQVVDEGRIGTVDEVRVFGGHDGLANFSAEWMYLGKLSGGGAMMDVGIHMTDLARYVLGEIEQVYGASASHIWQVEGSEDRALALFRSVDGVPVSYEATWNEWCGYGIRLEVYGDRGMVRGSYAPMHNLLVTQERPGGPRRRQRRFYPQLIVREKLQGWQSTTVETFRREFEDLAARLEGREVPLADGWAGFRAVEIAHAVRESSASGRPIRLSDPS